MLEVIGAEIESKINEINEYLRLLTFLSRSECIENQSEEKLMVDNHLIKTLKGSVFLLLYNLIEGTMRELVIAVHDSIAETQTPFDELRVELQERIIKRATGEGVGISEVLQKISGNISINLHNATLSKKDIFSANIDHQEIQKVSKIYGFSTATEFANTGHGRHLSKVKKLRNDLAHGNETFATVGSRNTIEEINDICCEVTGYILGIFDNVVDCASNKNYARA
ncbi:MAG: hypothetical protein EOO68_00005 [Moraxellaceae bacterium]|nr:MAG: hypothetical protein EOO68_00005 [Moraxellaceae bacterium]